MSKLSLKNRNAFTIIEVVIVLAIAALIIVIVLLAVAGLQRSQRTKAMQDAAGRVLSAMINWESDQGGTTSMPVPPTAPLASSTYITNANIPSAYTATLMPAADNNNASSSTVLYGPGNCVAGSTSGFKSTASSTQFEVIYWSETAGSSVCIHN